MALLVKTIEHLEGDYGLFTWPCAPVLAQYVYLQRDSLIGKNVLELGAGTAVPGIVAAICGANVTLSDREGNPRLQGNLRKTCEINNVPFTGGSIGKGVGWVKGVVSNIVPLSWGVFSPVLLQLPPQDVVLASDCFYDSKDFEDILSTVAFLMRRNPSAEFWTTYQERSSDRTLLDLWERWGMSCETVPLDFWPPGGEQGNPGETATGGHIEVDGLSENIISSSHTIRMWKVTRKR